MDLTEEKALIKKVRNRVRLSQEEGEVWKKVLFQHQSTH